MGLVTGSPGRPVDLDHVPRRVVEVEGERDAVIERHLDRQAALDYPSIVLAQIPQRANLEGGMRELLLLEDGEVVALPVGLVAQEGGDAERIVGRTAADDLHVEDIAVEEGELRGILRVDADVVDALDHPRPPLAYSVRRERLPSPEYRPRWAQL